jgi:hypothetical protein
MSYRRLKLAELSSPSATLATFATVRPASTETVAGVANVAGPEPKTALWVALSISLCAGWDEEDWRAAFKERAAILEYDGGHSRSDAKRLAREEMDERRPCRLDHDFKFIRNVCLVLDSSHSRMHPRLPKCARERTRSRGSSAARGTVLGVSDMVVR